jgi:release factor glutamine methyltransferase
MQSPVNVFIIMVRINFGVSSKKLFNSLVRQITLNETQSETEEIIFFLMEKKLGLTRSEILADKKISAHPRLDEYVNRINNSEPIQYILGEADFFGRSFRVNRHVLIPRPETEQLVEIAIAEINQRSVKKESLTILDIGTGSGCIPITIALETKMNKVFGLDISREAIDIAEKNNTAHRAGIKFIQHDILTEPPSLKDIDIVISNPPYVTKKEKIGMNANVLNYEPHQALFVPDERPLLFYTAIASNTTSLLSRDGMIILEINEQFGNSVGQVLKDHRFRRVEVIKDINQKDRFVVAQL